MRLAYVYFSIETRTAVGTTIKRNPWKTYCGLNPLVGFAKPTVPGTLHQIHYTYSIFPVIHHASSSTVLHDVNHEVPFSTLCTLFGPSAKIRLPLRRTVFSLSEF